jgi:hypothetical protein
MGEANLSGGSHRRYSPPLREGIKGAGLSAGRRVGIVGAVSVSERKLYARYRAQPLPLTLPRGEGKMKGQFRYSATVFRNTGVEIGLAR